MKGKVWRVRASPGQKRRKKKSKKKLGEKGFQKGRRTRSFASLKEGEEAQGRGRKNGEKVTVKMQRKWNRGQKKNERKT